MNAPILMGAASLVVWGILVFLLAIPSGWVHVPLVLGVLLFVKGIADQPPVRSPNSKT